MQSVQVFRPTTLPRTGERNAWILAVVSLVAYLLLWQLSKPSALFVVMVVFLWLSAFFISVSNWVDRKTILVLDPHGIKFRNGLRSVHLDWEQIERLQVTTDRWGKSVRISGAESNFNFRMLGEFEYQGKVRGQMGFPDGEAILKRILQSSGLSLTKSNEQGHYYARP